MKVSLTLCASLFSVFLLLPQETNALQWRYGDWNENEYCGLSNSAHGPLHGICTSNGKKKDCDSDDEAMLMKCQGGGNIAYGNGVWRWGDSNFVDCPHDTVGYGACSGGEKDRCDGDHTHGIKCGELKPNVRFSATAGTEIKAANRNQLAECAHGWYVTSLCSSKKNSNCEKDGTDYITAVKCKKIECENGYNGNNNCAACPTGTYNSAGGTTGCTDCPAGKYASSTASESCTNCPAGKYSSSGSASCTNCPSGRYSTEGSGQGSCQKCAAGKVPNNGRTDCNSCTGNTYAHSGDSSCTTCPAGTRAKSDRSGCEDIDECDASQFTHECPENSVCENFELSEKNFGGSHYQCRCVAGFTVEGTGGTQTTGQPGAIACEGLTIPLEGSLISYNSITARIQHSKVGVSSGYVMLGCYDYSSGFTRVRTYGSSRNMQQIRQECHNRGYKYAARRKNSHRQVWCSNKYPTGAKRRTTECASNQGGKLTVFANRDYSTMEYDLDIGRYISAHESESIFLKTKTLQELESGIGLPDLDPGTPYLYQLKSVDTDSVVTSRRIDTTCECYLAGSGTPGAGLDKPWGFNVLQENGFVMFAFQDLSRCEDGFSLTRTGPNDIEPQVFTSTYYYVSSQQCGEQLALGHQNSDDLSLSRLPVGEVQRYCVQAVGPGHGGIRYASGNACGNHQVQWEASIDGTARLPQHSGSLPVEGVVVSWEILKTNGRRLLHGTLTTDHTGKYHIEMKSGNPQLFTVDGVNKDVEVRITFAKATALEGGALDHVFTCEDGEFVCSGGAYTSVYVRHLDFGVEHTAVDISSKAISGKVVIAGTGRTIDPNTPPASFEVYDDTECPIIGAQVCLQVQNIAVAAGERSCVKTDAEGNFELGAPLGTIVKVEVDYFAHEFVLDQDDYAAANDDDGFLIEEEPAHAYQNFKFSDVHKAPLTTYVVGGMCDRLLGETQLIVTLPSCSDWKGEPFTQAGIMQEHYMPAHDIDVKAYIQGRNDIDMDSQGFDLRQVVEIDTAEYHGTLSREAESKLETKSEEAEKADMLRFQYNGTLDIGVVFSGDGADEACADSGTGDSFHVLEAYRGFTLKVKVSQYFGGDIANCDHIPDDTKVTITSSLGPDETNDAVFISELDDDILAEYMRCSGPDEHDLCIFPTCCRLDIEHTEIDDGVFADAKVMADLRAGPPNTAGEFQRSILIEVGGVSHLANVLVVGDYDDGIPERYPLPAMDPIMILRDPPGSNSYAYYENIRTTGFVSMKGYDSYVVSKSKYDTNIGTDAQNSMCAGMGAMTCSETVGVTVMEAGDGDDPGDMPDFMDRRKLLSYASSMSVRLAHAKETSESSFETTWSYQTPENWAGHEVDYFVVPSVSLLLHEVIEISYDNNTCSGVKEQKVKFSAESDSKENSVSFLSFKDVAILRQELLVINSTLQGIMDDPSETEDRKEAAEETLPVVDEALTKWETIIADYQLVNEFDSAANIINPADWFKKGAEKCEDEIMAYSKTWKPDGWNDIEDMTGINSGITFDEPSRECMNYLAKNFPSSHWSSLLPDGLKAKVDAAAGLDDWEDVHLLSFSGGGGKFVYELNETFSVDREFLPDKEGIWERLGRGALDMVPGMGIATWGGMSRNSKAKTIIDSGVKLRTKLFGVMPQLKTNSDIGMTTVKTEYEHNLNSKESKMGFVLSDSDIGDYFDVKVGIDPTYGSFVFKTVGGLSKCWHEEGTAIREQPEIDIISKPTGEILPDQPAIFQVKLINRGETWNEYDLAIARKDNTGGLGIFVNGAPLAIDQLYRFDANEEVPITISVMRGPLLYEYEPVELQLRSRCERTKFASFKLWTHTNSDSQAVIRYARDCPRLVLDGQLGSGIFMINANMERAVPLLVQNVERGVRGSLQEIKDSENDNLYEVKVKYREVGSSDAWRSARVYDEGTGSNVDLNLLDSNEDDYGFIADVWPLDQLGDGDYEVMIESSCPENPGEFQVAQSEIAIIKLDTIPPEPYSFPSETDTYHVGEPMVFEYDEKLDCERPYGFELAVSVSNVNQDFNKDNMLVVCEDRMIGVQFDGSKFDLDLLKGETATITLSGVRDPNSNEATNDAVVAVSFAAAENRAFRRLTSVSSIRVFQKESNKVTDAVELSSTEAEVLYRKFGAMESLVFAQNNQTADGIDGIKKLVDGIKKLVDHEGRDIEAIEATEDKLESLRFMVMVLMFVISLLVFMFLVVVFMMWPSKRG